MSELTRLAHECCEVLDLDPAEFAVPIEQHLARAVAALTAENERLRADKDVWGEAHEVACRRAEQAEREGQRLSDVATFQLDRAEKLQAEVERLKGELNKRKRKYDAKWKCGCWIKDDIMSICKKHRASSKPPAPGDVHCHALTVLNPIRGSTRRTMRRCMSPSPRRRAKERGDERHSNLRRV